MGIQFLCGHCESALIIYDTIFRISDIASMTMGIAEMHTGFGCAIQFIRREIISQHITTIVSKPEFTRFGMPVKPYRISNTMCHNFNI